MTGFGEFIRTRREKLRAHDPSYSLRRVAERIGVQPSYLSQIEREQQAPPSEETVIRIADELGVDRDLLLALAGKVSSELQAVIRRRPLLFGQLLRELRNAPDQAVLRLVREVRDGKW